jgi:ATP/maltotriose-dependent transcriptional regulator MalT
MTSADDVDSDESYPDSASLIEPLTRQEKTVLELIEQGLSNKDIARQLQISLNTLKVHIRNLYGKMGIESRRDILAKNARK